MIRLRLKKLALQSPIKPNVNETLGNITITNTLNNTAVTDPSIKQILIQLINQLTDPVIANSSANTSNLNASLNNTATNTNIKQIAIQLIN